MQRMIVTLTLCAGSLFALAAPAAAQGHSTGAEIEKQMTEISRLMRESERLLLEMTKIDRLVEQQRRLVEELKKLKPPEQDANQQNAEGDTDEQKKAQQEAEAAKRKQLQEKQAELRRKLEKLFKNQDDASRSTVQQLEKLLRNLPSGGGGGGSGGTPDPNSQQPKPGEEPDNKEQKQNDGKKDPKKDKQGQDGDKPEQQTRQEQEKQEKEKKARSQLARIEAWMARLPPAQQERISRNDFSGFPPRYRRLLREYTRLRAKREAEERPDDER